MTQPIPLTNGGFAIVSDEDYEAVAQHGWYRTPNGYAMSTTTKPPVSMHRFIMQPPPGSEVDHRSHDKLDNTRTNLRLCSRSQNAGNIITKPGARTSKYKGVIWNKTRSKWQAQLMDGFTKRRIYLGVYETEGEAARAYDRKRCELYGNTGLFNFPDEVQDT